MGNPKKETHTQLILVHVVLPMAWLKMAKPTSQVAVSQAEPKKWLIDQIGLARLISWLS